MCNFRVFSFGLSLLTACLLTPLTANALLLEDAQDLFFLEAESLCFYPGSFDPLHDAHKEIIKVAVKSNSCSYVFVYPNWGGDSQKVRSPVSTRLEELVRNYKMDPQVIISTLKPIDVQKFFESNKPAKGVIIYGILGEDVANWLYSDTRAHDSFMSGKPIPAELHEHTYGGNMIFNVSGFVLVERDLGVRLPEGVSALAGKPIIARLSLSAKFRHISSTKIKAEKKLLASLNPSDIS